MQINSLDGGKFMSLQLILGSAGSGKSYQLYREVTRLSSQNMDVNYLLIVPEQFTLQTQKDIVSMHPNHGVMNVDILSFLRFALRIFEEVGGNDFPILEDTGKSMVLRRVVADKKKDLILFGSNVRKAGFINELKSLLSEFYQYNVQIKDLQSKEEITKGRPLLRAKLKDIETVYEGFQDFMRERYITAEEILTVLNKVIDRSQWLKDSVICLDGFTGFTPCQYQLLGKMMQYAKKVIITVTIDPREKINEEEKEYELFGLSKKTIRKLYRIAEERGTEILQPIYAENLCNSKVPYRFINSPGLAFLEKNLFRYPYEAWDEEQDNITVHVTKDIASEVAFVAREINSLVREQGYRYKDIAIVTGDIERYSGIIKRVFKQENIPSFIDYKKEILNNPFAELIRAAITIVNEDYSYEGVFRYLRTGLTGIDTEAIDLMENYVLALGIRGSKRYSEPFTRTYRSKEEIDLDLINGVREQVVEQIQPLYEVLRDKSKTIKDYTTALYNLGVRLAIEEQLEAESNRFTENNMPTLAKEYGQIYRIVMELYDQMVLLLGGEQCSLKEYAEIIDAGLTEAKVGLIPPGVDEVVVGDTERTRLKDIRALFFIGVNEGIVPKSSNSGGILSDIERELLITYDIELAPTKRQKAFMDQFYLYLNVTKPKDKLYLTYHKVNDEGKSINPSYLIGKLQQLLKKLKIQDEDVELEETEDIKYILKDKGIAYLRKGFVDFHERKVSDLWKEIYLYYLSQDKEREILQKLMEGALYINKESGISKEIAQLLYGKELKGSVTRLERYAGCAYAHFLSYGLSLEERKEYKLAIPDIGNIFHNAIDEFSKRLDTSEYTWHTIPEDVRQQWAIECVNYAVEEYENSFIRSTKRNEYLIKRIERITIRTLWALCNQIRQGAFEPVGYEMNFYHTPDNIITLQGRIDRLDIYEEDDRIYVRVIDYKSGKTTFDFTSIYYGLQQQLSVYLSATLDYLSRRYPNKEIVPSGIFYYHIDDPIVAKTEQVEEEIYKSLKMNGLVNGESKIIGLMDKKLVNEEGELLPSVKSDIIPVETNKQALLNKRSNVASGKQILALANYVNNKLVTDSKEVMAGDTRLNPYKMGDRTACDYCEYKSICGFDLRLPGYNYRNLGRKSTDEIKKEIWGEGDTNGMD